MPGQSNFISLGTVSSSHTPLKTSRLVPLFAVLALAIGPSLQAQVRPVLQLLRRTVDRAPLNASLSVTRATPEGEVTITTANTFNGTSGTFDTSITLPNNTTTSVSGTISVTPGSSVSVSGSVTGPAGQSTSFTNTVAAGGTATTTFYQGGVIFYNGGTLSQASTTSGFFYDTVNNRLGLGTAAPGSALDVAGFVNTDKYSGYKQDGLLLGYASSTNGATIFINRNLDLLNNPVEAEPFLQKALSIRRKILGELHPDTAQSYNNVGFNLFIQMKITEAEGMFRNSLSVRSTAILKY